MTKKELASIIIPTYFRNERLSEAVKSALNQSYSPVEVIVVDDSGNNHAKEVVSSFDDVNYIQHDDNKGGQVARETGLKNSNGKFIQFLDDDDRLYSEKLAEQSTLLWKNNNVGVVYSGFTWTFGGQKLPNDEYRGNVLRYALEFDMTPCTTSTMLIEREVLNEILPLNRLPGGQDNHMIIKMAQLTEFDYVDSSMVLRDDPEGSVGKSMAAVEGRLATIDEFSDLYAQYPESVKRQALASTYLIKGNAILNRSIWSPQAIHSFAKAALLAPDNKRRFLKPFLLSLGGRYTRDLGRALAH